MPPADNLERMEREEFIRLLKKEYQRVLDLEEALRKSQGVGGTLLEWERERAIAFPPGRKSG